MDRKRSEKIVNERLEKIGLGSDQIFFFGRRSGSRLDPIFWDRAIHWDHEIAKLDGDLIFSLIFGEYEPGLFFLIIGRYQLISLIGRSVYPNIPIHSITFQQTFIWKINYDLTLKQFKR